MHGTLLSRYRLVRPLASGGMGRIYEAYDEWAQRAVAVKLMAAVDTETSARFVREANAVRCVDSPYVVRLLDSGEDPESRAPFMVMELLQGEDLAAFIERAHPLSVDLALRIAGQACLGLQAAHEAGLVHRDIKPSNLFLAEESARPCVKILDFGVAKLANSAALTLSGQILGTPRYMAPEQIIRGSTVDCRADLWSLGVVLFKALSGASPFVEKHSTSLLLEIVSSAPRPLQSAAPWVPVGVAKLVDGLLAREPSARPGSAFELLAEILDRVGDLRIRIEELRQVQKSSAPPPPAPAPHADERTQMIIPRT